MAKYNLFDAASLVTVPTGVKDGKLYSIKPEDGSGDFTFSRDGAGASPATRVNSQGLIEKGRENLLLQSNQFDTTPWSNSATLTDGESGYDNSSDAWLLTKTSAGDRARQIISSSGVNTLSVYAKANTLNWIYVRFSLGVGNRGVYFDLNPSTTGSRIGQVDSDIIAYDIEEIQNDWFRCSISVNDSITSVLLYGADVSGGAFNSNLGSIYIQDAQLEQGLVATDYIETTTAPVSAGLLGDTPRLDYSNGATCPSLLLEPSRTNLVPYSEYLSGLSLGNSPTITQNYAISPEGVQNAVRIQDTDGSNFKNIIQQFNITAGSTYTISLYVKKATSPISTYSGLYFDFDGGTRKLSYVIFDEYNGTLVNASGNVITSVIHPVIDEGDYWRFSATATDTGSNTILRAAISVGASANGTSLSPVIKDYTAYGFQCEAGSYPTSYIPTYGSASLRAGDVSTVSKTLPSEGSLFINVGGTSQPKLSILGEYFDASTTANKVAIGYSSTALVISHNGSIVVDKTGTYDVSLLTQIQLGHSNGADQADSPISGFITFDSFLTNNELNALTQ